MRLGYGNTRRIRSDKARFCIDKKLKPHQIKIKRVYDILLYVIIIIIVVVIFIREGVKNPSISFGLGDGWRYQSSKKTRFFVDSSSKRHIDISLLNTVMYSVVWIAKHTVLVWSAARSLFCCYKSKSLFAFFSCASL